MRWAPEGTSRRIILPGNASSEDVGPVALDAHDGLPTGFGQVRTVFSIPLSRPTPVSGELGVTASLPAMRCAPFVMDRGSPRAGRPWSAVEDLVLLHLELGVGKDTLLLEGAQVLELSKLAVHVAALSRRGGRRRGVCLLLLLGLLLLRGPPAALAPGNPVGH